MKKEIEDAMEERVQTLTAKGDLLKAGMLGWGLIFGVGFVGYFLGRRRNK